MKKKILVAEDDPAIGDVIKLIFENAGYDVDLRPTGRDLLMPILDKPDLFIIDRLLSGVDGITVCKYLKGQPATKDIPVIIISASPDARNLSKQAGADNFIEKPFRITLILDTVELLLAKNAASKGNSQEKLTG